MEALALGVQQFASSFDTRHGGFGGAPKFPRPAELLFLLRESARGGDLNARRIAVATLEAMAGGGMRDHIGGGFHRYSVDAAWRVPHFEKMLYDQAQLVLAYLEAGQAAGAGALLQVAEDTIEYVRRDMTSPDGAFYSAEDADSLPPEAAGTDAAKSEGAFYLWTDTEVDALLGADAAGGGEAAAGDPGRGQRAPGPDGGVQGQEHPVPPAGRRRDREADRPHRGRRDGSAGRGAEDAVRRAREAGPGRISTTRCSRPGTA